MAGYKQTTRNSIYLIPLCSFILGCELDFGGSSSHVQVQAMPEDSSLSKYVADRHHIEPHNPFILDFSGKQGVDDGDGTLLFRHIHARLNEAEGHTLPGSLQIEGRKEPWHGALFNIPRLDLSQAYAASMWVKTLDTAEATEFSMVLTRVTDGRSTQYKLTEELVEPGRWTNIKGEFYSAAQEGDNIHTVHLDVEPVLTRYLIDDVSVGNAEFSQNIEAKLAKTAEQILFEHVRNGDAEEGIKPWRYQGGRISRSVEHAHTGKYSILITDRTESWNAPMIPLQGLKDSKRYKISIFTRLRAGESPAEMLLTLKRLTNGQSTFVQLANRVANDAGWTEVSGIFSSPNISESETTFIYLESYSPTVSYYVDSVTVLALPDK